MSFNIIAKSTNKGIKRVANSIVDIELPSKDFLFTQASIVCSIMVEPNSFKIYPETGKFVNNNGDCWTNEALKANYKSFIGAYNFVNHIQEDEKAVGFIGDAALRRVIVNPKDNIFP